MNLVLVDELVCKTSHFSAPAKTFYMKTIYEGQIIELKKDIEYDYLEVIYGITTHSLPKTHLRAPFFQAKNFNSDLLIINYLKSSMVAADEGLLQYNEFAHFKVHESTVVFNDVFAVKRPFSLEISHEKGFYRIKIANHLREAFTISTNDGYEYLNVGHGGDAHLSTGHEGDAHLCTDHNRYAHKTQESEILIRDECQDFTLQSSEVFCRVSLIRGYKSDGNLF